MSEILMGARSGKQTIPKSKSNLSSHDVSSSEEEDETDSSTHSPSKKKGSRKRKEKDKHKMPLFRKQSDKAKKRSDHQKWLAQENPEPVFDVSNCELSEVPSGVFANCRVLQKEVLLLNDNWLKDLHEAGGGTLSDLSNIRVLDIHNNEIKSLPESIGELESLQVLNLENNKLSKLPNSIGNLSRLQTLHLKGNRLKELPTSLCSMKCLRMLDIRENRITTLPRQLCNVRTLETLMVDPDQMTYPPSDVCNSGTEDIMKFLCSESGLEYLPPSNFLLNVLDNPKPGTSVGSPVSKVFEEEENLMRKLEGYSNMMEKKRLERVELERALGHYQEEQAQLALKAAQNRDKLLSDIAQEETKMDHALDQLAQMKERDRQRLVHDLRQVEKNADNLVATLLDINAKAKKTEELLDAIEKERMKEDEWFVVRWEELENLRKRDVLSAMQKTLKESEAFEDLRLRFMGNKETSLQRALEDDEQLSSAQIQSVLDHNLQQQTVLFDQLSKQDQLQKEAFEALQLQKDTKHQRITSQIALIEDELAALTVVEIDRRELRQGEELNRLAEKRIALIELLSQLMFEQDCRQSELKKRLEEMEEQRQDGQTDYWLVQYQRLMDQKPQRLIDQERNLEIIIVDILERSDARDYMSLFARHRISIETLLQMTEDDLKQMGVHEVGVRKAMMRNLEVYRAEEVAAAKKLEMEDTSGWPLPHPSAPPLEDISPTRQHSVTARGMNSECSICLDKTSEVIFLNCGHVCCCVKCSDLVSQCPLCREDIVRRIKLMLT